MNFDYKFVQKITKMFASKKVTPDCGASLFDFQWISIRWLQCQSLRFVLSCLQTFFGLSRFISCVGPSHLSLWRLFCNVLLHVPFPTINQSQRLPHFSINELPPIQASAGSAGVNYVATTPFPVQIPPGGQLPHLWNHNMVTVFPHGNAMATVSNPISERKVGQWSL